MRITRLLFTLFAIALSLSAATAQVSVNQRFGANLTRGYYTFGLNAGWAYQTSDVRVASGGYGFGATLAKNLYYRNNAIFAFDLRGRLLLARTYGLDPFRSYEIAANTALNGDRSLDYTTYPVNLEEPRGFVFQNHRTDIFELGLEGVLTFNRLRERTGFVLSLFGGIGADWYRAKIDQADANGDEYFEEYAALKDNIGESTARQELRDAILDGVYETNADGFANNTGKIGLMPNLGVEIGYQLAPRFSVHLGHRVTFAGTDLLDGQRWAAPDNDIYHYTNFALRWIIQPKRDQPLAPVIEITTPITNPYTTNNPNDGVVRANIRNINSAADVTCMVNGRDARFDYRDQRFSTDFPLRPGRNDVIITATNRVGTARKEVVIYYEDQIGPPPPPPAGRAPYITILNPPTRNTRTSNAAFTIRASVQEITNKNDITLEFNGNNRQSFSFDSRSGELYSDVTLREGENRIYIRARNTYGTANEEAVVIYDRERESLPTVYITRPDRDRVETQQSTAVIEADVLRLTRQGNVTMTVNGRQYRNFTFDAGREQLRAEVNLEQGSNYIEINASNAAGQAKDGVTIDYRREVAQSPPTIAITEPSKPSSSTSKTTALIEATTQFVSQKSDIRFYMNGRELTNFTFNTGNGRVSSTVNLENGNNEVRIRVANRDGSDEASVSIRRIGQEVEQPLRPDVTIAQPLDGASFDQPRVDLRAKTERVSSKENVTFTFNGRTVNDFNFNRLNGDVTATLTLVEGNNVVRITGRNDAGTDEATVNLRYRAAAAQPTVSIAQPANNSTATTAAATLKATTQNVSSKSEVSVLFNGRSVSNFSFDVGRQEVTASLTLENGNNVVTVKVQNSGGNAEATANVRYNAPKQPTVSIAQPANNSTATTAAATLKATTQNVSSKSEVSVLFNGRAVSNFSFDVGRQEVTASLTLENGNNVVTVKVQNSGGNAEATANVRYNAPKQPTVSIAQPANNSTATTAAATLKATTQNVSSKSEVSVLFNGRSVTNFSFDAGRQEVTASLTLENGNNVVTVKVQNSGGNAEATANVRYNAPKPPVVAITNPATAEYTSKEKNYTLRAAIQNVSNKSDISLKLNGQSQSNFTFTAASGDLSLPLTLEAGANVVVVSARNSAGSDEKSVRINYAAPQLPIVEITAPKDDATVTTPTVTLKATIRYVSDKKDVTVTINGKSTAAFTLNEENLSAPVTGLKKGSNRVEVTVRNSDGSATDFVLITYEPGMTPKPKPEVRFVQPAKAGSISRVATADLVAEVKNVTSKSDVVLKVNKAEIRDFGFDAVTGQLQTKINLTVGTNTIEIEASNTAGSASATTTILLNGSGSVQPPVVTIASVSQPTINPLNPNAARSTIIARIEYVSSKDQITFSINGRRISDFSFNERTGSFDCTFELERGENSLKLRAETPNGADEETRTINF